MAAFPHHHIFEKNKPCYLRPLCVNLGTTKNSCIFRNFFGLVNRSYYSENKIQQQFRLHVCFLFLTKAHFWMAILNFWIFIAVLLNLIRFDLFAFLNSRIITLTKLNIEINNCNANHPLATHSYFLNLTLILLYLHQWYFSICLPF